jgi:acyl carrier protein
MKIQETLHNYIITERFAGRAPEKFDDDYDLIDSGTIDSLFVMNLITYVEQQYKIEFGMNDMVPRHFKSVNALAAFVNNKAG